jgi:hypothetical protein
MVLPIKLGHIIELIYITKLGVMIRALQGRHGGFAPMIRAKLGCHGGFAAMIKLNYNR